MYRIYRIISSILVTMNLQVISSPTSSPESCAYYQLTKQLTCRQDFHNYIETNPTELLGITKLNLNNFQRNSINIHDDILAYFKNLEELTIDDGNIRHIYFGTIEIKNQIRIMKLNHLAIDEIPKEFLLYFPKLQILDLTGNSLQQLPHDFYTGNLQQLYLLDNHWNCSKRLNWVFNFENITETDLENVTCYGEPYHDKPLLTIALLLKEIHADCPIDCNCSLPNLVRNPDSNRLEPIVEVNCSYRGLQELPDKLPLNTKILHLEGNEITEIKRIKSDPIYRQILDIYLDNNKIMSIKELEGSYWLRHFRVLSLNGNKVTELPTYAIDHSLEQNPNMPNALRLSLGQNPWRCDCVFTPVFQEMLQKFEPQIQDITEIKCSYVEGDENSLVPIIELSRSSVCRLPSANSIQPLDLLNGILASLILLILGKLAYDYYYFKKTGRLPWIVTKMP